MKNSQSAPWRLLGQAILDYAQGNIMAAITVKCNLEADRVVPLKNFFHGGNLSYLEKIALSQAIGKTLDAGAGSGSHSLILQKKEVDVTAMDISKEACKAMKIRGLRNVICHNFFNLREPRFDTILMLMNGIGISGDLKGLDRLLEHAHRLLLPQGRLICDSTDVSYVSEHSRSHAGVKPPYTPSYYGEAWYQLYYKGENGEPYPWLFVDKDTLLRYAQRHHFTFEVLGYEDAQYLARLTKLKE